MDNQLNSNLNSQCQGSKWVSPDKQSEARISQTIPHPFSTPYTPIASDQLTQTMDQLNLDLQIHYYQTVNLLRTDIGSVECTVQLIRRLLYKANEKEELLLRLREDKKVLQSQQEASQKEILKLERKVQEEQKSVVKYAQLLAQKNEHMGALQKDNHVKMVKMEAENKIINKKLAYAITQIKKKDLEIQKASNIVRADKSQLNSKRQPQNQQQIPVVDVRFTKDAILIKKDQLIERLHSQLAGLTKVLKDITDDFNTLAMHCGISVKLCFTCLQNSSQFIKGFSQHCKQIKNKLLSNNFTSTTPSSEQSLLSQINQLHEIIAMSSKILIRFLGTHNTLTDTQSITDTSSAKLSQQQLDLQKTSQSFDQMIKEYEAYSLIDNCTFDNMFKELEERQRKIAQHSLDNKEIIRRVELTLHPNNLVVEEPRKQKMMELEEPFNFLAQ